MAPKSKAKAGAAGSGANVPQRRSSSGAASGAKAKAKGKAKADAHAAPPKSPEDLAVMVWQGAVRCFQGQQLLAKLSYEKKVQDAEMDRAMREAHAAAMAVERKRDEALRQKEAEKRQKAKQKVENTKKLLGAAFDGDVDEVQAILDNGLAVDSADHLGTTSISEAATSGHTGIVNILLEKKANPNSQGEFKRTPLWRAAYASHDAVVQLLLEAGGDPRITDDSSQMPLDVASKDSVLETLRAWDVSKTDELVEDYESWFEEVRLEEEFRQKQIMKSVDSEYDAAKAANEAAQMMLAKAKSQMRNREKEYGLELAAGHDKAREACASADEALQRAESEAFAAQARFDKASIARMGAAEKHGVSGELLGREVSITDLNNVLVRDLGNRTREGTRWTLVIDPNDCAKKLLFYSGNVVLGFFKAEEMEPERIRIALLTMIRAGGTVAVDLFSFGVGIDRELLAEPFDRIRPGLFEDLCSRSLLQRPKGSQGHLFQKLITKEEKVDKFRIELFDEEHIQRFKFVILTSTEHPHKDLVDSFDVLRVSPLLE